MKCIRCQGVMVEEWIFTRKEGGTSMSRCLNCGNLIDGVVISNRGRSSVCFQEAQNGKRRSRRHPPSMPTTVFVSVLRDRRSLGRISKH